MPIVETDLVFRQAEQNDDTSLNGGKIVQAEAGASVFPDITGSERDAGIIRYRKLFYANEQNASGYSDLELLDGKVFLRAITPAGDNFRLRVGTEWDDQSDASGYSNWGGVGYLEADAAQDAVSIQVRTEQDGVAGEQFIVGSQVAVLDQDGNIDFHDIDGVSWGAGADANLATLDISSKPLRQAWTRARELESGIYEYTADGSGTKTVSYSLGAMTPSAHIGSLVRIKAGTGLGQVRRITANTASEIEVEYGWTTTLDGTSVFEILNTYVAHVVALGNIVAKYQNETIDHTSGGGDGTYTFAGNLKVFVAGTVDDTWTLTYDSGTNSFQVVGTRYGNVGTFTKGTNIKPANGGSFYFELPDAGFDAGAWGTGDFIRFTTKSAGKGFWVRQRVPAGTDPHLANEFDLGSSGDSV